MKNNSLKVSAVVGVLGLAFATHAEETKSLSKLLNGKFTGSISGVSDYKFRGISQTSESPAIQGNIDFVHQSGVKVGVWGSNTDFGSTADASLETDFYASYTRTFNKVILEGGTIYYLYPSAKADHNYDYAEFYGSAGYDFGVVSITGSLNYSPDFFGASGVAYYPKLYVKVLLPEPLPKGLAVDASIGHQWIDNNVRYGVPNYTDWSAGLSYTIEDFTIKAQYVDTNIGKEQCALDACEGKLLFSVSKAF